MRRLVKKDVGRYFQLRDMFLNAQLKKYSSDRILVPTQRT